MASPSPHLRGLAASIGGSHIAAGSGQGGISANKADEAKPNRLIWWK